MSGNNKQEQMVSTSKKSNTNNDAGEGLNFIYSKAVEKALEHYTPPVPSTAPHVTEYMLIHERKKKKVKTVNDQIIVYRLDQIYDEGEEMKKLSETAELHRLERGDILENNPVDQEKQGNHGNHGKQRHVAASHHRKISYSQD